MKEIENLQQQVDEWIRTVGLRYFNELTNMAVLTEEVGEVARIMARRYGEQSEKESDKQKDLGEELADVLFVTLCLANQTGIDLQQAFDKKMELKEKRDAERHRHNDKLKTEVPHVAMVPGQRITITGSKSETNRLLILRKLYGNLTLNNISNSQDSQLLIHALSDDTAAEIDIHHAGTAMRFLTSWLSVQEGRETVLTGSSRMKERPIHPLVTALRALGADIEYLEKEGFPPLKIKGKRITKNQVKIPANISSQFITSLLLIGAKLENGLTIELEGEITSLPYLMMTVKMLNEVGIKTQLEGNQLTVAATTEIDPLSRTIESDWSSASYFYSLAAIGRKEITLQSFKQNSLQADRRSVEIYRQFFGVETIYQSSDTLLLKPISEFQHPEHIELNMNDCPDIAQTVCVTATALKIPFYITGLHTLRIKETDRLLALQNELRKLGLETEITDSTIRSLHEIEPQAEVQIATYNDHRMAMAFAPFALCRTLKFENPGVVEKSYPDFWEDFYKTVKRI